MIEEIFFLLALWCTMSTSVIGGLLPEAVNNGYQYNRPTGSVLDTTRSTDAYNSNGRFIKPVNGFDFGSRSSNINSIPGYGGIGYNTRTSSYPRSNIFNNGLDYPAPGTPGYNADQYRRYYNDENNAPRPYSFQYEVRDPPSGNDYGQQESSDGNVVRGEYRVLLPDTRTQVVTYTADDVNGYNADVRYEGQPQYQRPPGYQFNGLDGGYYKPGFGPAAYQGRVGYNVQPGVGGYNTNVNGIFRNTSGNDNGVGVIPSNQYLPPTTTTTYGK